MSDTLVNRCSLLSCYTWHVYLKLDARALSSSNRYFRDSPAGSPPSTGHKEPLSFCDYNTKLVHKRQSVPSSLRSAIFRCRPVQPRGFCRCGRAVLCVWVDSVPKPQPKTTQRREDHPWERAASCLHRKDTKTRRRQDAPRPCACESSWLRLFVV